MRTAGNAVLTMMKIGTIAQRISDSAFGREPALRRKVAIEWIMTANTPATTNAQIHRTEGGAIIAALFMAARLPAARLRARRDAHPAFVPAARTTAAASGTCNRPRSP